MFLSLLWLQSSSNTDYSTFWCEILVSSWLGWQITVLAASHALLVPGCNFLPNLHLVKCSLVWEKSSKLEDFQLECTCSTKSLWCRQFSIKAWAKVPVAREMSTSLRPQQWRWFCQGRPGGALGTDLGCSPAADPPKVWLCSCTSVRGTPHTCVGEDRLCDQNDYSSIPTEFSEWFLTQKIVHTWHSGVLNICADLSKCDGCLGVQVKARTLPVSLSPRSEALFSGYQSHKTWSTEKEFQGQF